MTEQTLQLVLESLARLVVPKPEHFVVRMVDKTLHTGNGCYIPQTGRNLATIEVYNLTRTGREILTTAIHDLAHHLCFCEKATEKHTKHFYRRMHELLEAASAMGYVDYDTVSFLAECRKMEQICGRIRTSFGVDAMVNAHVKTIVVDNHRCMEKTKEVLLLRKFTYNPIEWLWEKNAEEMEALNEKKELEQLSSGMHVAVYPFTSLHHDPVITITVEGATYRVKEKLRERGYRYCGAWKRLLRAGGMEEEEKYLAHLGLHGKELERGKADDNDG